MFNYVRFQKKVTHSVGITEQCSDLRYVPVISRKRCQTSYDCSLHGKRIVKAYNLMESNDLFADNIQLSGSSLNISLIDEYMVEEFVCDLYRKRWETGDVHTAR